MSRNERSFVDYLHICDFADTCDNLYMHLLLDNREIYGVNRMDDKTFKEYYEIERLRYCMGVVADWLNEHREYEIVESEYRGIREFAIQTKHSSTIAELKKIFPFCCYEPDCGADMRGEQNG